MRKLSLLAAAAGLAIASSSYASIIYGIDQHNVLFTFDSAAPSVITSASLLALPAGVHAVGIDFRPGSIATVPTNGLLYVLADNSQLFTVNTANTLSQVSLASTLNTTANGALLLNGTSFGVDFNPTVDRLRITSDTNQNLRVNVDTGVTTVDGALNATYGDPAVVASAYTNSFPGATTTTLYNIDASNDSLTVQNPPNDGTQTLAKPLGIDVNTEEAGFDIEALTNVAYLAANVGADRRSGLYTVNLTTGTATSLGLIGNGILVRDIAVAVPEPTSLVGLAAGTLLAFRRRRA